MIFKIVVMDSNSKKNKKIEKPLSVEEEAVSYQSKSELETENSDDYWDNLPEQVKKLIQIGLKQCEEGQLIPHEKVMNDIKKKYNIS